MIALFLALIGGVATAEQHARVAVVVGLDQPSAEIPAMEGAEAQAEALASVLRSEAGYGAVFTLVGDQATADAVVSAAEQAIAATSDVGTVLFVYAGRGAGGDFDEPAFLTSGASVADPMQSGLSMQRLAGALAPRVSTQSAVVMIDAADDVSVDGVALIGPSADDWPQLPEWGVALTSPDVQNGHAIAGQLLPALVDALSGDADENTDGSVTISELTRFAGQRLSRGVGVPLVTAGSVDAGLRVSTAGRQPSADATPPQMPAAPPPQPTFALQPGPVVVGAVGLGAGIASIAMYASKRADCVEFEGTLRCGNGDDYERYRAAQISLGWSAVVLTGTAVGLQVAVGRSNVALSGRF